MLEGKELEGSISTINDEPAVKYSLDIDDHGVVALDISVGVKIDLKEQLTKALENTTVGKKIMDFVRKFEVGA